MCARGARSPGRARSPRARALRRALAVAPFDVFGLVDAAARGRPPDLGVGAFELHEKRSVFIVEDECPSGSPVLRLQPAAERAKPAEALGVRNGSVGRRGRGQDEESYVVDRALLRTELGALTEHSAVGLLADERDCDRAQVERDASEPFGRAREIAAAEIARARCRPVGGIRDPDGEARQVELLARIEQAWRESRFVEQPPEVVARVGEMRARSGGDPAGIDAAEDDDEPRREHVRNCTRRDAFGALS
jgi:hypothetical protein